MMLDRLDHRQIRKQILANKKYYISGIRRMYSNFRGKKKKKKNLAYLRLATPRPFRNSHTPNNKAGLVEAMQIITKCTYV